MRTPLPVAVLLCAFASSSAAADDTAARGTTVGVSVDASVLLGVGLSVGIPLGDRFNARLSHHFFSHDEEIEDDGSGANYDGELDLKSTGLLGDWHPFQGAFRVTAGLMANGNQINLVATDDGSGQYAVGDCTYQSDMSDPLTVRGVTDFKSTVPYLGIGWGGNMNAKPGFFGTLDIGVMFSGSPDTRLSGSGSAQNADPVTQPECGGAGSQDVSSYPEFQQALRDAERDVNEETKDFKLWPNLSFGIGWRF